MEHYSCSDAEQAWTEGWGKYLRLRYLLSLTSLKSALAVFSFFKLKLPYAIMVSVLLATAFAAILIIRYLRVRISYLNTSFHNLTHSIRDQSENVISSAKEGGYRYAFQEFNSNVAEHIAIFFRHLLNNRGITCAIRLASFSEGNERYITVGRSSGFDLSRKSNSQAIPSDQGVARILRQKNQLGVILVKDIEEAIKQNTWYETKNDKLPDVTSVMVAPINGYVNGEKSMLGLLYIGAKKDIFSRFHVDIVRGFADLLGTIFPVITGHLEEESAND